MNVLFVELALRGLHNRRQVPIAVNYKNCKVREPLFLDILVSDKLIIEVKATGVDYPIYHVQLGTYMRLTGITQGLIINFGKKDLKEGIFALSNTIKKEQ